MEESPMCVYCHRNEQEVALIELRYREAKFWICPQHLPILIHKPENLAQVIPGAEKWGHATHEDHG